MNGSCWVRCRETKCGSSDHHVQSILYLINPVLSGVAIPDSNSLIACENIALIKPVLSGVAIPDGNSLIAFENIALINPVLSGVAIPDGYS